MLTPYEMQKYQKKSSKIYNKLQWQIIGRIIESFVKAKKVDNRVEYLTFKAIEMDVAMKDIDQFIKMAKKPIKEQTEDIVLEAGKKSYNSDKNMFKFDEINQLGYENNTEIQEIHRNITTEATTGMLDILTALGIAIIVNNRVKNVGIRAYMDITLDTIYNGTQAGLEDTMNREISKLADSGIRYIDYANNKSYRLDTASTMEVMKNVDKINEKTAEYNATQLKTNVFEITWHTGHRRSHGWGGLRYDVTGKYYPTLDVIYMNNGGGTLNDYNCRHSIFPVDPETPPKYSLKELRELEAKELEEKEWNGKGYNKYEQTQLQRAMERKIKKQLTKAKCYELAGEKGKEMQWLSKYRRSQEEYIKFCNIMDLQERIV